MSTKKYTNRFLETYAVDEDLIGRHTIFLAGPRQTGKTKLAKEE